MPEVTITVQVEVEVSAFEDVSGLTLDQLAEKVTALVRPERDELAAAIRVAALKLMAGEDPEEGEP